MVLGVWFPVFSRVVAKMMMVYPQKALLLKAFSVMMFLFGV